MKIKFLNILGFVVFFVCFVLLRIYMEKSELSQNLELILSASSILVLGFAIFCLFPKQTAYIQNEPTPKKLSKRTIISFIVVLLLVPITVFVGEYFFKEKKYYFISLLIIIEIMLPFFIRFENKNADAREIVIISVLSAIAVVGRIAFSPIPEFKPVVAMIIISGIAFGGEAGFLVGAASGLVSNFYFGQGAWTPWQMFGFGIIGFLAGVFYNKGIIKRSRMFLTIFGFISTVVFFGGIMNISTVLMYQPNPTVEMFVSSIVMGLPFDVIHGLSTAFFIWFIAIPMFEKLDRIKLKYGIK